MSTPVKVPGDAVERSERHPDSPGRPPLPVSASGPRYDSLGRRLVPRGVERVLEPLGSWAQHALCQEVDGDLWFPDNGANGNDAKTICQQCEVRTQCLEYALTNSEHEGIWGGLSAHQRAQLKRKGNVA